MWILDIFRKKRPTGPAEHPVDDLRDPVDRPKSSCGSTSSRVEDPVPTKGPTTRVSREKIEEIVEGFIQNNSVNSALLPDFIERAIYTNVVALVLGIAEEVLEGTSIEILGHRVEMKFHES